MARLRRLLRDHASRATEPTARIAAEDTEVQAPTDSPLAALAAAFGLSPFERDVLGLCAAVELAADFPSLCASAVADPSRPWPTFGLALAALPGAHWSALSPASPLRRWRLVEVGAGDLLTHSPLRIDERVLHHLAGVSRTDERLAGLVTWAGSPDILAPSHQRLAESISAVWSRGAGKHGFPTIQLSGDEVAGKRAIAAAAAARVGLRLGILPAEALPAGAADLESLARLWEREATLGPAALFVDCEDLDSTDQPRSGVVGRFVERLAGALVIGAREPRIVRKAWHRTAVSFDVAKPTTEEQRSVWQRTLGALAAGRDDAPNGTADRQIDQIVGQFNLSVRGIRAAAEDARGRLLSGGSFGPTVWDACRLQARARLDDLAGRVESVAGWDDLVLPEPQKLILREASAHVRQRSTVYERWGFAAKSRRGLGISALFVGPSGTGKTMAAEVLANELRLDLYRIDLSAVVSKYIGETEKNLRRIFDAADDGGAILLFDEADALFGKRSEVKDSHDRYANIEVSYLLQRMESYRGLAILTTNMRSSLDSAFLRRIRFIVQFPFPDAAGRAEIWRRVFPAATPTDSLDVTRLAQLNVSGGNIRNIALNAAFLAADADAPVRMSHVLRAARGEYSKLEKTLTEAEIAGWV